MAKERARFSTLVAWLALVSIGLQLSLLAESPPLRAGMISSIAGEVKFSPSDAEKECADAKTNATLTSGNQIWTADASGAKIEIGSTAVYLGPQTRIHFINLADNGVAIALHEGDLYVHIRHFGTAETFEISTLAAQFGFMEAGAYRIHADESATALNVRSGNATLMGVASTPLPIAARQLAEVRKSSYRFDTEAAVDPFESSCQARDVTPAAPVLNLPPEVTGGAVLQTAGTTIQDPLLGQIWKPTGVPPTWAPYQDGQWTYVEPWGWTWVDNAPWGFAPSHYGRWVHRNDGWAWVPPSGNPVYAPALVAFVGGDPGAPAGDSAVAWFPLGPGEIYTPGYTTDLTYWSRVNVTNTIVSNGVDFRTIYAVTRGGSYSGGFHQNYANQNVPAAITAVPFASFGRGESIRASRIRLPMSDPRFGRVVGMTPAIPPTRESVFQSSSIRPRPAVAAMDRPVVYRGVPPPQSLSFSEKQAALAASRGRPLDASTLERLRQAAPPRNSTYRSHAGAAVLPGAIDRAPHNPQPYGMPGRGVPVMTQPPNPLNSARPMVQPSPGHPAQAPARNPPQVIKQQPPTPAPIPAPRTPNTTAAPVSKPAPRPAPAKAPPPPPAPKK